MVSGNKVTQISNGAEERQAGSIRLPRDLWRATRVAAAEAETTIGALIEEALRKDLAFRKKKA